MVERKRKRPASPEFRKFVTASHLRRPDTAYSKLSAKKLEECEMSLKVVDRQEQRQMGFSFNEFNKKLKRDEQRKAKQAGVKKNMVVIRQFQVTTQLCR